jgi:Domain of unknown function (DUF4407)
MQSNHIHTKSLSRIRRLLSWPSGVIPSLLAQCPSEQNYYCGLGILVWFNSMLAGGGMALMLSQTTASGLKAIAGGAFWFLCILNLDRFLLLATYENTGWKRLMPVSRFLLSLCLAIIIGEHVVQYIFHNEINNQLAQEKLSAQQHNRDMALQSFPEIAALNDEKSRKQAAIEKAKDQVAALRAAYIGEAEGTAGTHIRGKGPLYEQKQRDYKVALSERESLQTELQEIQNRLDTKTEQLEAAIKPANEAKDRDRGFLSYHRALFEIIKRDITLLFLYIVISLAMILFEITPLLSKLGGKARLHDLLAAKETELKKSEEEGRYEARLRQLKNDTDNDIAVNNTAHELTADTLEEVAAAIRTNTQSSLSVDQAELAKLLMRRIHGNLNSRLISNSGKESERSQDRSEVASSSGVSASVTVITRDDVLERSFDIDYWVPRETVMGSDLINQLVGLKLKSPVKAAAHIPVANYRVTNASGESIKPNAPLFSQLNGAHTVYLSLFEPTASQEAN